MISAAQEQERTKVVQTKPPSSRLVLSPFITGLDPFELMALAATTAEHFRRRQGRGGARRTISPSSLFWICRNGNAGCKSETILQRNDYFRILRVGQNQNVDLESTVVKPVRISLFCVGSKSSKWAQQMNDTNLTNDAP